MCAPRVGPLRFAFPVIYFRNLSSSTVLMSDFIVRYFDPIPKKEEGMRFWPSKENAWEAYFEALADPRLAEIPEDSTVNVLTLSSTQIWKIRTANEFSCEQYGAYTTRTKLQ